MKTLHFDTIPEIDGQFYNKHDIYIPRQYDPLNEGISTDIEVITCMHSSKLDETIITKFPNLKYIITRTVGVDHISISDLEKYGIKVFSIGQYGPQVIATHAWSLLLSGIRDLARSFSKGSKGDYDYRDIQARDITNLTIGVIGVGNIGKQILRYAKAWDMKLLGCDVFEDREFQDEVGLQYVTSDKLFQEADIIVLSCNLTDENKEMIQASSLEIMKQGAILINIARGELINEDDLLIYHQKFSYIALDVIRDESKIGAEKFQTYNNIFLTPHIAHYADATVKKRWEKTYSLISELT